MKQTNNAIKFLMAQYRAIFKNANIAMVAAMVAAALATGQAQAKAGDQTEPFEAFEQQLADGVIAKGEDLVHDAKSGEFIILKAPNTKPIVIDGGKLEMTNAVKGHIYTTNDIVVKNGKLSIAANNDSPDLIPGLVGSAADTASGAQPTVASLTVEGGKVDVNKAFIQMKNVTINGGELTAGGTTGKKAGEKFLNYSNIYALNGEMNVGGNAVVNLNPASGLKGNNVTITGGTINFNGTSEASNTGESGAYVRAGDFVKDGTLTVSGGKLVVAQGKYGNATGTNIKITGGEVDVKGTFTLGKDFKGKNESTISVTGGKVSVANGGTLGLDGNASFTDGTLTNAGTVAVAIAQDGTRSLTLGSKAFSELLKGKLTATGVNSAGTETFNIVVDGDADLVTSGFLTADGAINTTHAEFTDVDASSLTAKNVTIGAASYSGATAIKADSLVAGKAGAFAIKSGSTVEVAKGLTVTPNGETKDLTVNGILNLSGAGGNVAANITLASADSSSPELYVNKGVWNLQDLKLTSGAAVVDGEGTEVNIAGTLTTTQTNGTLAIKNNALVNASEGVLNLAEATVALTGGSTLVLDGNDVFKIAGGSASLTDGQGDNKSKYVQGAVTTDSTSVLQLKYTGQLSLANIESIKTAMDKSSGLAGFIKFEGANITDKPTGDVAIGEIKPGVDGIYNDVTVTVGTGGAVNQTFTAGQIKLTDNSNTAAVANDKTVMLTGSKGDFVVKSGGEAADASLGSGSSLVLAGDGAIGAINGTGAKSGAVSIGHSSLGTGTVTAKEIGGTQAVKSVDVFNSKLNVAGKVATDSLSLEGGSSLNITAAADSGSVSTDVLSVGSGSSISAAGQEITISGTTAASEILGDVTAKSLAIAGTQGAMIAGDAVLDLETLTLSNTAGVVQVGDDAADTNGSATVIVDKLLGAGTLFVDPQYGQKAALVIANSLSGTSTPANEEDAGTLQGSAIVGKNAALGIGFASEAELKAVLGQFLDANGSFTENPAADKLELANALVLNKKVTVDNNKWIVINPTASKTTSGSNNQLDLAAGTGLIVTDNVYKVEADGTKTGSAIAFGSSGTVSSSGGKVILSGNFDGQDNALQIFQQRSDSIWHFNRSER